MGTMRSIVVFGFVAYFGFVGLLYVMQRPMMYPGDARRTPPAEAGFAPAVEETVRTADGETVILWHVPPRGERPVVLYFHGNGGALRHRARRFAGLIADGTGLVALSYRGYGGSSGSPSEDGLIQDARAAYAFARERYPPARLVAWGESLGSGVAIALAAEEDFAKLVLEAPYTSAADIAALRYPIVPVRALMKDQFRSDERIVDVEEPVLVLHGDRDPVIPIEYGRRLFDLISSPKQFIALRGAGHEGLDAFGAVERVKEFIGE